MSNAPNPLAGDRPISPAARVIGRFGGVRPMARILSRVLGRRVAVSTVQGWSARGMIPAVRQAEVLLAARTEGIVLTPEDFFPSPFERAQDTVPLAQGCELLSVSEMARADKAAAEGGISGETLMEAAGRGAVEAIAARFAHCPVSVLCGPGNNGGDGFVIARLLKERGWPVRVGLLGDPARLVGDAALNARRWTALAGAGAISDLHPSLLDGAELAIDAIFGAGLARDVEGDAARIIDAMGARHMPVVAVDMPSGVDGDTGQMRGTATQARLTVTFFRKKPGHLLLPGRVLCGELVPVDIGIPDAVLETITPSAFENSPSYWENVFPWPRLSDHKYTRGHLVIGGGADITGAARLAARAAMRIGAGLVSIASTSRALPIYATAMPGVLTAAVDEIPDFADLIDDPRRRAVLLGPGYGTDEKTHAHVLAALGLGKFACLDADALTVFAGREAELFAAIRKNREMDGGVVLTPHEGEFARLFSDLTGGDKPARARAAAERSGAVVLLKGADSVIADPDGAILVNGNAPPTLATGGTGDVLAGFVAGLLVQGVPPFQAAGIGAWMQGAAAQRFGPGLIAEDLPDLVPAVLRSLKPAD